MKPRSQRAGDHDAGAMAWLAVAVLLSLPFFSSADAAVPAPGPAAGPSALEMNEFVRVIGNRFAVGPTCKDFIPGEGQRACN